MSRHRLVIAVDYGTTFTGVSYAYIPDTIRDAPTEVKTNPNRGAISQQADVPNSRYSFPLNQGAIRLLDIATNPDESTLWATLRTTELRQNCLPHYQALSYTWGRNISVDGSTSHCAHWMEASRLSSTQNSSSLNRHIGRALNVETSWTWMDALCINQEDQGNSQNQVTTMRETYQDASIIDRELWNAKMPTDRPPSDPETTGSDIRIHNAPHLECLTAVCQHAAQILKEQHGINTTDNLSAQVVVRVPAVWSFFARKGALQAVQQAFPTLECTMSRISKAETTAEPISSSYEDIDNSAFIVCDAGGGTCDVVSYDVQKLQPYLKLGEDTRTMSGCRSPHSLGVSFDHNQHHGLGCMFTDKDITRHVRSDLPELGDGRNVHGIRIKTDTISTCVRRDQDIPSVPKDQAVKYGHRGRLWNSDPNSVKPLEYSRDFSNFYKRTLYSFVDSAFITTLLHSMRDLVVRLSKGFSVADANCPLSCSWCWTCRPTLRRITKSSIISLSLVANVIIMMYGFEHGINLPQSSAWSSSWASKTNVFAVHWILHPPSLLFFVTCIILAWLLAYYFELNELHRHQAHILVAGLLIWPLTAVIVACSVLASIFHILPWTVWISFVISEIIHYFLPEDRKILVFLSFSAHTKKECLPEAHELDEGKAEADIDERCNDLDSHRPSRRQGTCHTYKNVTKD